jgi:nucleotide-binding universal stress UspA family protein
VDPPFARIVVGVDQEARSTAALLRGARLAAMVGAELDLLHVVEHPAAGPHPVTIPELLHGAGRLARREGLVATSHVLVGRAADMLAHQARERWADLICLGAGSPGPLGAASTAALRRALCSVLIARAAPLDGFPGRILCAVDGSEGADEAVRQAAGIARRGGGASLRLLHVAEEREGDAHWMARGDRALRRAGELAARWDVEVTSEMAVGAPAQTVAGIADVWRPDLVVVGSRGLRGVGRWLLGSVSEAVARLAPTSVLVARRRPW